MVVSHKIDETRRDLVSVVIPCYNHGRYLPDAIESVLAQSHKNVEIIVVDDGSKDDTREVASRYKQVLYVHQNNQGLSASRNNGIKKSKGSYIVFLDADDWLLPDALDTNLRFIQQQNVALVAGAYVLYNEIKKTERLIKKAGSSIDYNSLLEGNIISMHGAVMFQRWVFDHFEYDTSLRGCEDWDIYLKISRRYPIIHHSEPIAVYRKYNTSMSDNLPLMLENSIKVLNRQKPYLKDAAERKSYLKGKRTTIETYKKKILKLVFSSSDKPKKDVLKTLFKYDKTSFLVYMLKRPYKLLLCLL